MIRAGHFDAPPKARPKRMSSVIDQRKSRNTDSCLVGRPACCRCGRAGNHRHRRMFGIERQPKLGSRGFADVRPGWRMIFGGVTGAILSRRRLWSGMSTNRRYQASATVLLDFGRCNGHGGCPIVRTHARHRRALHRSLYARRTTYERTCFCSHPLRWWSFGHGRQAGGVLGPGFSGRRPPGEDHGRGGADYGDRVARRICLRRRQHAGKIRTIRPRAGLRSPGAGAQRRGRDRGTGRPDSLQRMRCRDAAAGGRNRLPEPAPPGMERRASPRADQLATGGRIEQVFRRTPGRARPGLQGPIRPFWLDVGATPERRALPMRTARRLSSGAQRPRLEELLFQ